MGQRYWVIGGEYADCGFKNLQPGSETVSGPFAEEWRARTEWQRLTFRDQRLATQRYSICVEPEKR